MKAFRIITCLFVCFAFVLNGTNANAKKKKFKGAVVLVEGQYYTPDDFGAKGDGKTDDTDAIREALYQSNTTGKVLFIPPGRNYLATGSLNFYNEQYQSYTLNIQGTLPPNKGEYTVGIYGGITMVNGVELFKNATIKGSIRNISIVGVRDESVHLFDNCTCSNLGIIGCNISNLGCVFYDTNVDQCSKILYSKFLTAFYFARNNKTSSCLTDSDISFNYINGGEELNDNACFEWVSYNGVTLSNNFIDYYQTVYRPNANRLLSFVGPNSSNNQYQVFRYLYFPGDNINTVTFFSLSDTFNWTSPSSLDKLLSYKSYCYIGQDGSTYDYPPYIGICHSAWKTNIIAAKIERNIDSIIFVESSLTEYEYNEFNFEAVGNNSREDNQIIYKQGSEKPYYNGGRFPHNEIKISGIEENIEHIPPVSNGWSSSPYGRTISYMNKTYKLKNVYSDGEFVAKWVEE